MRTLIITLLLILPITVQACPKHQLLIAGDIAPCSGHFFNNDLETSIRKDVHSNKLRKKQIELKDLQIRMIITDRDNWKAESMNQAKARHELKNDFRNGAIVGGTLAFLAVYLAGSIK